MKALLLLALLGACAADPADPQVSVGDDPDAAVPTIEHDYCALLEPSDSPCCGQLLGCSMLQRWCAPRPGTCVHYLCPLTDGTNLTPGLCAP